MGTIYVTHIQHGTYSRLKRPQIVVEWMDMDRWLDLLLHSQFYHQHSTVSQIRSDQTLMRIRIGQLVNLIKNGSRVRNKLHISMMSYTSFFLDLIHTHHSESEFKTC